jgi:hypothetical protein
LDEVVGETFAQRVVRLTDQVLQTLERGIEQTEQSIERRFIATVRRGGEQYQMSLE